MAKYKKGLLEQCIKDLIADYFEEILNLKANEEKPEGAGQEDQEGTKARGRVRDPEHDKRLKGNRSSE